MGAPPGFCMGSVFIIILICCAVLCCTYCFSSFCDIYPVVYLDPSPSLNHYSWLFALDITSRLLCRYLPYSTKKLTGTIHLKVDLNEHSCFITICQTICFITICQTISIESRFTEDSGFLYN